MNKKRNIIIHAHIFKNAGSSFDSALERNFSKNFVDHREDSIIRKDSNFLKSYLTKNEHISAFSSHSVFHFPQSFNNTNLIPIFFLRHPIERIKSVYSFEKQQPKEDSLGAKMAKGFNFGEYIEWRMKDDVPGTIRNLQTIFLSGNGMNPTDMDKTYKKALENIKYSLIGIVDRYDESMVVFEEYLTDYFPDIDLSYIRKNITDNNQNNNISEKIQKLNIELGDELLKKVYDKNCYDLKLYKIVNEILDVKIFEIKDFDKKLINFKNRCKQKIKLNDRSLYSILKEKIFKKKVKGTETFTLENKQEVLNIEIDENRNSEIHVKIKENYKNKKWLENISLYAENYNKYTLPTTINTYMLISLYRLLFEKKNLDELIIDKLDSIYKLFENDDSINELIRIMHAEYSINIKILQPPFDKLISELIEKRKINNGLFLLILYLKLINYKTQIYTYFNNNFESTLGIEDLYTISENLLEFFPFDEYIKLVKSKKCLNNNILDKYYYLSLLCYIKNESISKHFILDDLIKELESEDNSNIMGKYYGVVSNYLSQTELNIFSQTFLNNNNDDISIFNIGKSYNKNHPKVALCISGQLRGYQKTYDFLKDSIINDLQPDIFVSTWKDIGSKEPVPVRGQANRILSGEFLDAWLKIGSTIGVERLKIKYKEVFDLLGGGEISKKELSEFYNTPHIEIDDDCLDPFINFTNPNKMYYKMYRAHQMMLEEKKEYDLVIRLRPDRIIKKIGHTDWDKVIRNSSKSLIADFSPKFNQSGLVMGDMLAISSMQNMNIYSNVWESNKFLSKQNFLDEDKMRAHAPLAYRCWAAGINVTNELEGIRFRELLNPKEKLDPDELMLALGRRLRFSTDKDDIMLYNALIKDINSK